MSFQSPQSRPIDTTSTQCYTVLTFKQYTYWH